MSLLYHLTDWPFSGLTPPPSLAAEGFVHLCTAAQLLPTAERWFSDHRELAVAVLEQDALQAALVWEDSHGHGGLFPHHYAALPEEALVGVLKMSRDASDQFIRPSLLPSDSPLLETPDVGEALIEPSRRFQPSELAPTCILHFFPSVSAALEQRDDVEVRTGLGSAIGPQRLYLLEHHGVRLTVCQCGVGGPLAAVALEELIALGCRRFVTCGGAGSLLPQQPVGSVVLVDRAVRDEGVSHHYLQAASQVWTEPATLARAEQLLASSKVPFRRGASWTTDALYRETPARIARRRAQGCLMVEMELASLLAVAQYRKVPLLPLLFSGDDLGAEQWDFRDWTAAHDVQQQLFWLAARLACALS